jgi:hypothetical protein
MPRVSGRDRTAAARRAPLRIESQRGGPHRPAAPGGSPRRRSSRRHTTPHDRLLMAFAAVGRVTRSRSRHGKNPTRDRPSTARANRGRRDQRHPGTSRGSNRPGYRDRCPRWARQGAGAQHPSGSSRERWARSSALISAQTRARSGTPLLERGHRTADIRQRMNEREDPDPGVAGHSARREYERRRERRQRNVAAKSGFARLLAALLGPSAEEKRQLAHEKSWATGAEGEQLLAESLARRCPEVSLLHDRRMPNRRANIDHIAVAASGVYVIDTKRYRGTIKVRKPLIGSPKLKIAGRDRTKLLDGLAKQVAAVQTALSHVAPAVPVRGCLCFVAPQGFMADSGLPVLRTLKVNGYSLYYPRRLAKRLNRRGSLTAEQARVIHAELATRFPPA